MKRIVFSIFALCICHFAHADTVNVNWLNADGTTYSTSTCTVGGDIVVPQTPPTKYGYTFVGWNIPYTPIEYLESTGTQYINTGIILSQYTAPKIEITGYIKSGSFLIGCYNNNTGKILYISTDKVAYDYSSDVQLIISGINALQKNSFVCEYKNNTFTVVSGALSESRTYYGLVSTYPLYLFGRNTSGTATLSSSVIYNFKFYDNGTLVRDMIPVIRNSDGAVGMYDSVNSTFYANAGTGDFVAGPEI